MKTRANIRSVENELTLVLTMGLGLGLGLGVVFGLGLDKVEALVTVARDLGPATWFDFLDGSGVLDTVAFEFLAEA